MLRLGCIRLRCSNGIGIADMVSASLHLRQDRNRSEDRAPEQRAVCVQCACSRQFHAAQRLRRFRLQSAVKVVWNFNFGGAGRDVTALGGAIIDVISV